MIPLDSPDGLPREHDPTCSRASLSWSQCCAGEQGSSHLSPACGHATWFTWSQLQARGQWWGSMARSGTDPLTTLLCPSSFSTHCHRSPARQHIWGLGPIFPVGKVFCRSSCGMGAHVMQWGHPKRGCCHPLLGWAHGAMAWEYLRGGTAP